jgi:hypothetical protein
MAQDWDIKPRGDCCERCETPFADQQPYHTVLFFGEEGYARTDMCQTCWEQNAETSSYSAWQGVFRMPPPPAEEPLKKETAETLLRKLMEDDDPGQKNVIYILAVMLERKRILVERSVQREGGEVRTRVYEHRETGESFLVPDPHLGFDALETVQEQVIAMLGGPKKKEDPAPESGDKSVDDSGEGEVVEDESRPGLSASPD